MSEKIKKDMECILSQLLEFEKKLRTQERLVRNKINGERATIEKLSLRRDFYNKLQASTGPKQEEAVANLDKAQKDDAVVQLKMKELESMKSSLSERVSEVKEKNRLEVMPEINRIKRIVEASRDETNISSRACADEEQRIAQLNRLHATVKNECINVQKMIDERDAALSELTAKPAVYAEEMAKIKKYADDVNLEIEKVRKEKKEVTAEIKLQNQRILEIEKEKKSEQTKLDSEIKSLEKKHQDVDTLSKELSNERVRQHSLASQRLEMELNTKTADEGIRHNSNFLTIDNRQLNVEKSVLAKKQQATAKIKSSIPQLRFKLQELEQTLSIIQGEKHEKENTLSELRAIFDSAVIAFLEQEHVEEKRQRRLDESARSVAEKEGEIEKLRAEERRASTLLSLMKEKREVTRRKIEHAEQIKSDVEMAIHLQELLKLDVTKKLNDTTKKWRDLSSLHEMIKNEKMECTRLIQLTNKTLMELKQRSESLHIEIQALSDERTEKMKILSEEVEARVASQDLRTSRRIDKSKRWLSCRRKLEEVERQEARIDKLRTSVSNSQKEVERIKLQIEQMINEKQSMSDQLTLRREQLLSLYDNANTYSQVLKKGELVVQKKIAEKRLIELKNKDIQRNIDVTKKELHESIASEERIEKTKKSLELQVLESERISRELENPMQERFRTLDGYDPTEDELATNLTILERLEQNNKGQLMLKEIAIKQIAERIFEMEEAKKNWKLATQSLLQEINEFQGRLHELKRVYTAQKSEIHMYDELISQSMIMKNDLEHDVSLREHLSATEEPRKRDVTAKGRQDSSSQNHVSKRRPTAYLPMEDGDDIIRVPRPFGANAPFQPIKTAVTLRQFRKPKENQLII